MHRVMSWKVLIDRFMAKLSGWKASLLLIGGHLILIKFVLGILRIYYMSIFKALEMVIKELESLHALSFGVGDSPFCDHFNRLYHLENSKDCLVRDCISNGSWSWDSLRPISSGRSRSDFIRMLEEIGKVDVG
ncbi:hypothetical protein Tco_1483335 [Tanacetum coccineum]